MARITSVKKAQKDQGKCTVCGKPITIGMPYKWAHPRYRGRIVACEGCAIPLHMLSGSKMVAIYEAQAEFGKLEDGDDKAQGLRDLAETVREVSGAYQESADNQREYFPESSVADENEEKAQSLEAWADELDSAADEVESAASDLDDLFSEQTELESEGEELAEIETDKLTPEQATRLDEINARLEEIDTDIEEKNGDIEDKASEADNCPV